MLEEVLLLNPRGVPNEGRGVMVEEVGPRDFRGVRVVARGGPILAVAPPRLCRLLIVARGVPLEEEEGPTEAARPAFSGDAVRDFGVVTEDV